jgi:hypothetical protein
MLSPFRRSANLAAAALIVTALAIATTVSWTQHRAPKPPLPPGTIGAVESPVAEATVGTAIHISGWALDPAGMRGVDIRVDGRAYPARYGVARRDVAEVKRDYPDAAQSGFSFDGDFAPLASMRHEIAVVAINRSGVETVLAKKGVIPPAAMTAWRELYSRRHAERAPPFYVLPGLSGIALGGALELAGAYDSYVSPTVKFGMRVPILYLRTTLGEKRDWLFDPDWNVEVRCGQKRIAEDSLSAVMTHSIDNKLPVLFTLNGGIWADAGCDVPAWDVNDHLEQDTANCQWNEHDEVMPDDYLKHLTGATESPELGRSLTFNVYAAQNRHYKKRNLQAAGRMVVRFAREHPELFAGVTLDADSYLNPFFEERQWYDYNPGTLKQFRHWLAGTGPYAGVTEEGVPDLSRYLRAHPLTLAQASSMAGKRFRTWEEVDPPRVFPREGKPFWEDRWTHEWEMFRRHLVKLHYDELSEWLVEVGIPPARIFSSQGFIAPYPGSFPFAVHIDSPTKNHDSGGMSIEGAIPVAGHLGAIVYGGSAINDVRMEDDANLFATFHRMDPGWAVGEFNTADFRTPNALPTYAMGYRALREMFNYGARYASPMAWNGSNGFYAGQPGYVSFMAWRNTPLEDAMRDFAVSHAYVPLGSRLWTFGSAQYADSDGWTAAPGASAVPGMGYLDIETAGTDAVLVSPPALAILPGETDLLVVGIDADALSAIAVDGLTSTHSWVALSPPQATAALEVTPAGISVPLVQPAAASIEQIRIRLTPRNPASRVRIRHLGLLPPAPG